MIEGGSTRPRERREILRQTPICCSTELHLEMDSSSHLEMMLEQQTKGDSYPDDYSF